mgnify:FL=1
MKVITAMDFRKRPGYFFFRVAQDHESFTITHQGKPVARLVPMDDVIVIESDGTIKGEKPLTWKRPDLVAARTEGRG